MTSDSARGVASGAWPRGGPVAGGSLRIAAVGDLHMRESHAGRFRRRFEAAAGRADVLLLAGDLTQNGSAAEASVVAEEVRGLPVPVVAVLGNHDHLGGRPGEVAAMLAGAGVRVLDYTGVVLAAGGLRVGVAGGMGWRGGFTDSAPPIGAGVDGDRERLARSLAGLDCDLRVALTHYAPVPDTLAGEPQRLYPELGSWLLGEVIDAGRPDLVVHGHAHHGVEHGVTAAGVPVRNVARPVIRAEFRIYVMTHGRPGVAAAADRRLGGLGRWWLHRSSALAARTVRLARPPRSSGDGRGRGL